MKENGVIAQNFREHFPLFLNNPGTVYFDSASSAQKPSHVIDSVAEYLRTDYANIHRGAYDLSEKSELRYQASKKAMANLIGADSPHELIYSSNATGAMNLLVQSLAKSKRIRPGDRIVLSILEHHANIVPWQMLQESLGIEIVFVEITEDFRLDMADFRAKLTPNTRVVSLTGASNVTGTIPDWNEISRTVRSFQTDPIYLIMDASQLVAHEALNVRNLDLDFAVFTGHKIWTDPGIGILYGKKELLKSMIPSIGGGGAINFVSEKGFEPAGLPFRFEPGTPNMTGAASLLAMTQYFEKIGGYPTIRTHEQHLIRLFLDWFSQRSDWIWLIGPKSSDNRAGVFSFVIPGQHANDVADFLASEGICVRSGHHCTEPLHTKLGITASVRASVSIYNTEAEIAKFFVLLDMLK